MLIKVMINDRAVYLSELELYNIIVCAGSKSNEILTESVKKNDSENIKLYSGIVDKCVEIIRLIAEEVI